MCCRVTRVHFKLVWTLWKGFIYLDGQEKYLFVLFTGPGSFIPLKSCFNSVSAEHSEALRHESLLY